MFSSVVYILGTVNSGMKVWAGVVRGDFIRRKWGFHLSGKNMHEMGGQWEGALVRGKKRLSKGRDNMREALAFGKRRTNSMEDNSPREKWHDLFPQDI